MKTLKPQVLKYEHYEPLEGRINDLMWELVFRPIIAQLKKLLPRGGLPKELKNSPESALRKALRSGAVQMVAEAGIAVFVLHAGKSSRELADAFHEFGAKLNKTRGAYTCAMSNVPAWVKNGAEDFGAKSKEAHAEIDRILRETSKKAKHAVDAYNLNLSADHAVSEIDKGWKESAKALEVVPTLNVEGRKVMSEGLSKNAKIPIVDWVEESTDRLREQVEENALKGYRSAGLEGLVERIQDELGVSHSRVRLIARQETANFMSAYRAARAKDAGCKRFKWSSSLDKKVRPLHKKLHGRIFSYDDPPIIDETTGKKGFPGQTFNCRCVDMPVLEAIE